MGGSDVAGPGGATTREGVAPGGGGEDKSSSVSGTALMEAIELTTNGVCIYMYMDALFYTHTLTHTWYQMYVHVCLCGF